MYNKEIGHTNTNNGYLYFCDSHHPLSDTSGRVYLHRHLASLSINRWLTKEEHVHHKDGDRLNNEISNLEVLTASEHAKLHKPELILLELACPTCGSKFIQKERDSKYCNIKCSGKAQIKDSTLTKELLDVLIPTMSWVRLGEMFGYTDNGIKKRAKTLGCTIPKRR